MISKREARSSAPTKSAAEQPSREVSRTSITMGPGALARFPAMWNHASEENAGQGKIPGWFCCGECPCCGRIVFNLARKITNLDFFLDSERIVSYIRNVHRRETSPLIDIVNEAPGLA
jgi:hypothetical protein